VVAAELAVAGGVALLALKNTEAKTSKPGHAKYKNPNPMSARIGRHLAEFDVPHSFATRDLKAAFTNTTEMVRETPGFRKNTSENEGVEHPAYFDFPSVPHGDDEKGEIGRSASSTNREPANTTHTGSIKPARRPLDRESYVPK